MFKRTGPHLDTQPSRLPTPTPTQQTLTYAFKNAKLLPDGRCCLNDSLQNQLAMFKYSFFMYAEFSTATAAIFGQKQTVMLHLFTTTNSALGSTFGRALCMTF